MEETKTAETTNVPIESVNSGIWQYIRAHYLPYLILYVVVCVVVLYFFFNTFSIIAMVMIGLFVYKILYRRIESEFVQEFGKSISFTYTKTADMSTVSGKLFKTGHSQYLSDVLSGAYQNTLMRIFSFGFTVGYGKSSHSYSFTVFEATLEGVVPDISLYSEAESFARSAISDWLSGDETVELEGDFNKYFKLRVPKGHEQEAYQIFTPDVMTDLIDKARNVSFEFVGNKLYIYANELITKMEKMQSMLDLSEYLAGLFKKNTANMKSDI